MGKTALFGRKYWDGFFLACVLAGILVPSAKPETVSAAPVSTATADKIPNIPALSVQGVSVPANDDQSAAPSQSSYAVVPPLTEPAPYEESDTLKIFNSPNGNVGWRLPIIGQQNFLSRRTAGDPAFLTGSLPLDPDRTFDIKPLLAQSEEFLAVRSLLEEGYGRNMDKSDDTGSALSAWSDNSGWESFDSDNRTRQRNNENRDQSFSSLAIDMLNPTDTQRETVRKTLSELKNYIAVAQPNSQDIILQDPENVTPVTIEFKPDAPASQYSQNDPYNPSDADASDDDNNVTNLLEPSKMTTQEYTQIFSFHSIWEFMTSAVMIALYILLIALWAAWHYVIRRFV
jgi:hypothetical protein